jgi:hypothetical protein
VTLPRTSGYDNTGSSLSPILAEKSKGCKRVISQQLIVLKATFCAPCKVGEFGELAPTLLLAHTLDLQISYFQMTMG